MCVPSTSARLEISVCRRYDFFVLPCVYNVIANGVKNIGCVSLALNYSFEITVCEKRISLVSCRKIRFYFGYYNFWVEYCKTDIYGIELYLQKGKEKTCCTCFFRAKPIFHIKC